MCLSVLIGGRFTWHYCCGGLDCLSLVFMVQYRFYSSGMVCYFFFLFLDGGFSLHLLLRACWLCKSGLAGVVSGFC